MQEITYAIESCKSGFLIVAQSKNGICLIVLGDTPADLSQELFGRYPDASCKEGGAAIKKIALQLKNQINSPTLAKLNLTYDIEGTPFQQRVWQALSKIPFGTTVSYSDIAKQIGAPTSMRAVAQACGANRLAVVIPCHRVVRNDGSLSGYRWGVARKQMLIDGERLARA